nr:hypothetical protein [Curtobacterium sp. MCPF17_011]
MTSSDPVSAVDVSTGRPYSSNRTVAAENASRRVATPVATVRGELLADARRIDGRGERPGHVVLTAPGRSGGVGDGQEARRRVVRERPVRAARQSESRDVALVVERPRDSATERVDGVGEFAAGRVLELGACTERVRDGGDPAAGGVLEPPDGSVGIAPLDEHSGCIVAVLGAGAGRTDGRDGPTGGVALDPGGVADGVRAGDEVTRRVVRHRDGDPGGVHHASEEPVDPGQLAPPADGVDDDRRVPVVAAVLVGDDGTGLGHDGGHAVLLVVPVGDVAAGGSHRASPSSALVVRVDGD